MAASACSRSLFEELVRYRSAVRGKTDVSGEHVYCKTGGAAECESDSVHDNLYGATR